MQKGESLFFKAVKQQELIGLSAFLPLRFLRDIAARTNTVRGVQKETNRQAVFFLPTVNAIPLWTKAANTRRILSRYSLLE